jgi:hypothetical protein
MKQLNDKSVNNDFLQKAKLKLYKKHYKNISDKYNLFIINNILSNSKCHIVSKFKDYLLYDDISEFLKRFYKGYESGTRLKKISHYFKETSVLYPNYSPLIESKYIYSNIIKKQMVINKQENYKKKNNRNHKLKKQYQEKNEKENKEEQKFFSSTIYNDILNESESFMNLLFGVDNKNKEIGKEKKDRINVKKKYEDVDDFIKIIDIIEKNEDININNNNFIEDIEIDDNEFDINNKHYYKKMPEIAKNISKRNRKKILSNINYSNNKTNENISISNISNNNISNSIIVNRYKKNNKNFIKVDQANKISSQINIFNNNDASSKENNNNINSIYNKQDISNNNNNKIVYHRKVKSTLIGNYLNKLELPSNSNVVNLLKFANETYAENTNKNSVRASLYKGVKYKNKNLRNSITKIINLPKTKIGNNLLSAKSIKNNSNNSLTNRTEIIKGPEMPNSTLSRFTKIENISKKIEISKRNKNNYFGIKKRGSPLSTRNYTSIISFYENMDKNNDKNISNSNRNIFNSINSKSIAPNNSVFYSSKKPENGFKSIYVNPNFTGPYSKPKCIYKDKKLNGLSARKLFNKSNELINKEKENVN